MILKYCRCLLAVERSFQPLVPPAALACRDCPTKTLLFKLQNCHSMPMPLMPGGGAEDKACGLLDGATPFRLPKLDVFGEKKGRASKKRAEEVASEDEEDPREEAQVSAWFIF